MTETHVSCLKEALSRILGVPAEGTIGYIRCLPTEVLVHLAGSAEFEIPGWEIYAVGAEAVPGKRWITADRAVDLREEKEESVLLLVDPVSAGAGMDGIYSAGREIGERVLLDTAIECVRKRLSPQRRAFADRAVSQARRLGRVHVLAPYRVFDFYSSCSGSLEEIGAAVALLGLWPIAADAELHAEDLEVSAKIVERLLLTTGASTPPQARVESLLLSEHQRNQVRELEAVLRRGEGRRWTETVLAVREHPELWLNRLEPGFARLELRSLDLVPWRGTGGKLLTWSGLVIDAAAQRPTYLIPPASEEKGKRVLERKLEVRWKVQPPDLPAGAAEYEVAIITGSGNVLASRTVSHTNKEVQRCAFTREDFEELEEDGKWEAQARVHPLGTPEPEDADAESSEVWKLSEEFLLSFGEGPERTRESVGRKVRALVEEAVRFSQVEFLSAVKAPIQEDRQGYLICRMGEKPAQRSARVGRPALVHAAEQSWQCANFAVGRWMVSVRSDGSVAGSPRFDPLPLASLPQELRKRLEDSNRVAGQKAAERGGFVGVIYRECDWATAYVNAWAAALEAQPALALAQTIEVRRLSGEPIGLIVLPGHPLLVAWHQAYDELAFHLRYSEKLKPGEVVTTLQPLDGSYFPSFLPGLSAEETFVFGDTLGFYAVAMLRSDEPEPQAAIAQLARCLSSVRDEVALSVGGSTAEAVGREIARYSDIHPEYSLLRLRALRPGDGLTVAKALGVALGTTDNLDEEVHQERRHGFFLELHPSPDSRDLRLLGRFLAEAAERRRAGAGSLPAHDRWMLESYDAGGVTLPVLRWAKRSRHLPQDPAHLSLAFDTFDPTVQALPESRFETTRPLEIYGLAPSQVREFQFAPIPTWITTVAPQVDGERHPAGRPFTDRLLRLQTAVLRASATNMGGSKGAWPALITQISAEKEDALRRLHELSDWVITVDRNAGIEYFDAPSDAPQVYETYVIDCVPERQDLETVQLVTSTSHIEEVKRLLDRTLADMALSCSSRNCEFLLANLKAVSGRLAMRLASHASNRGELIALSLFHAGCSACAGDHWLSLHDGFFVPLDDVRELLLESGGGARKPAQEAVGEEGGDGNLEVGAPPMGLRSDLVYVSLSRRGALQFRFIEVKYRRLLKSARSTDLLAHIQAQTAATRARWMASYFDPELTPTQLAVRRKRLARALRFYLEKAQRHHLGDEPYRRLGVAIDRLFRPGAELAPDPVEDRGYIFCPDHSDHPQEVACDGETRVLLFGPASMPDPPASVVVPPPILPSTPSSAVPSSHTPAEPHAPANEAEPVGKEPAAGEVAARGTVGGDETGPATASDDAKAPVEASEGETDGAAEVVLGHRLDGDAQVSWHLSIQGNPHLMIVGLPGMGKTTCLVNLCSQLAEQGITPVVFSYHEDLEDKLAGRLGALECVDAETGLGFNPMRVAGRGASAWIDNVGMLRDIFAAIFPDLGDLQTNEIREALKQTYQLAGFANGGDPSTLDPPTFQGFFDILRAKSKPNAGLMARLGELDDYGFFQNTGERSSLLGSRKPVVLRLHTTQNEVLQNATASFVLFKLYQNMFQRGVQRGLTHAVLFDEAHRASRLKLLPTMAKECRKFGVSLVVASQEAKDFSSSLYAAIANYLVLRVTETDAYMLSKNVVPTSDAQRVAGRLKQLSKYTALFVAEGQRQSYIRLLD